MFGGSTLIIKAEGTRTISASRSTISCHFWTISEGTSIGCDMVLNPVAEERLLAHDERRLKNRREETSTPRERASRYHYVARRRVIAIPLVLGGTLYLAPQADCAVASTGSARAPTLS